MSSTIVRGLPNGYGDSWHGLREMEVKLLGTGTPMPIPERSGTSIAVTVGDETLLIDCGPGTARNLTANGIDLVDIDTVFFTHQHPDHNGGFLTFATTGWILGRRSLKLYGPPGTGRYRDALEVMYGEYLEFLKQGNGVESLPGLTDIDYVLVEGGFHEESDVWSVAAMPVEHHLRTVAYRFESLKTGASFVFSADTRALPSLATFAEGADLLVHEATLAGEVAMESADVTWPAYDDPDESTLESMRRGHSTATEAAEIAESAGVDQLVLTHLMKHRDYTGALEAARSIFGKDVTLAEDGLTISIG